MKGLRRIPETWRLGFLLWLGMRLLLWALSAFLFYSGFISLQSPFPEAPVALTSGLPGALFGIWMRWDGGFYYLLLTQGYAATPSISAFWPLYPLLARPLAFLGIHPLVALILVGNLALLAALVVFLAEVRDLFGSRYMLPAGLALLVFPGAFFFYAPFPMSLALLLVLLSYRFARRGKWVAAAVTGLLSGLTHPSILPLAILLAVCVIGWLRKAKSRYAWLNLAVPFMPFAGVALFLAWREAVGLIPYVDILKNYWKTSVFNPLASFLQLFQSITSGNPLSILKVLIIVLAAVVVIWLIRQRRVELAIYQAGLLLYLVSFTVPDHPMGSFIRYFLLSFPVFMALGVWLQSRRWWSGLAFFSLAAVNLIFCSMYLSWVFVA